MKKHCAPISAYRAFPAKAVEVLLPTKLPCIGIHIAHDDLKGALSCRVPELTPGEIE